MSLAIAEPVIAPPAFAPEEPFGGIAGRSLALSAVFHLALGAVLIVGLPKLFDPPVPEEMPIAVQLVTIAPETRATHPNPDPRPEAKPEVPDVAPPVAKPELKPEPPRPTPVPPPAAAVPPPPEPLRLPEAKPERPKALDKAEPNPPPPKPPEPKPETAKTVEKPFELAKPRQKPEQPRQMAKQEPKPEEPRREAKPEDKKYDPKQFEALLKNLAPQETTPSPDAPPQKARIASARASSQPRAPLGGQLTANELDMVRHQIARCWNIPAGARDARDLVVEIKVIVDADGTVRQATIVDQGRLRSDPFFRAAAESARRAFFNPLCRPLHLPAEKYAIWKDLIVDFSPKDIL
jgi:outer membrane biosynthesis protein TonB